MTTNFDIIILGAGTMGSAVCYFLSKERHSVLALDQFNPPHESGSHTGQSRIIRKAYFEHSDYVPLLNRAYENWRDIESASGQKIYYETGIAYFGKADSEIMEGSRRSARLHNISLIDKSAKAYAKDLQISIPDSFDAFNEPEAGFLLPDRAIAAFINLAKNQGGQILTDERVLEWKSDKDGVMVKTTRQTYCGNKLIITAGSWTSALLPKLRTDLKVTKQLMAWVEMKNPDRFQLGKFPCWFIDDPGQGLFYGFPVLPLDNFNGPVGMKFAHHVPGEIVDPENFDDVVTETSRVEIVKMLERYFPTLQYTNLSFKHCLYTYSPDSNFIIDYLPDTNNNVIIACGFSGHGFKFASVVGEILSDMATKGKTKLSIDFLKMRERNLYAKNQIQ